MWPLHDGNMVRARVLCECFSSRSPPVSVLLSALRDGETHRTESLLGLLVDRDSPDESSMPKV